jgi:hypothetical protein
MDLGNEYIHFSQWVMERLLQLRTDLAELLKDGAKLDQGSIAARYGKLVFKQVGGTDKGGRRFEYSCIMIVDSATEEDLAKLSVTKHWGCIWWVPEPPTNTELPRLVLAAGLSDSEWSTLMGIANGKIWGECISA